MLTQLATTDKIVATNAMVDPARSGLSVAVVDSSVRCIPCTQLAEDAALSDGA